MASTNVINSPKPFSPIIGGTGLNSYAKGDVIYCSATNVLSKLAVGPDGASVGDFDGGIVNICPENYSSFENHCFNLNDWDQRSSGTGSGVGQSNTFPDYPGVFQMTTGTDPGGKCSLIYSTSGTNNPNWLPGSTQKFYYSTRVNIGSLGTLIDTFDFIVGANDGWIFGGPGNGFYFEYDSTTSLNWLCVSNNSNTPTKTDSGVAVATGWVNLAIRGNNSSVDYFINDVLVDTNTTNLPTNGVNINGLLIFKTLGVTSVTVYQDFFKFIQKVP